MKVRPFGLPDTSEFHPMQNQCGWMELPGTLRNSLQTQGP
jgi:hypothetical protein